MIWPGLATRVSIISTIPPRFLRQNIRRISTIKYSTDATPVIVAAKTTSDAYAPGKPFPPDPNSPHSTINTVAREIVEAGGEAYALSVDVRHVGEVERLVIETARLSGGRLDVLVYNSGAIWWSSVAKTPTKRFQLMQRVNPEGLYAAVQAVLPVFERNGRRGRIIVVSPPIYSRFFRGKTAYAMGELYFALLSFFLFFLHIYICYSILSCIDWMALGKVGMSVLTRGLAMDFERQGAKNMAITSIWPAVVGCTSDSWALCGGIG